MKTIYIILIMMLFSLSGLAQQLSLRGKVLDSSTNKPLVAANVIIVNSSNLKSLGTTTDPNGKFEFTDITTGKYTLTISYLSYKTHKESIDIVKNSIDLQTILLTPGAIETGEVEVVAKAPRAVIKDDTTEYNAAAYKTNKDAAAEDLLAKMPGVTVQNGKVQAQGEDIKHVLVDGKQYFGDDPSAALKNIPAEVIDKIQVFDKQSEQSEFTGFNDGNTEKTINIVTRMKVREGTFGKFYGGYGDQQRYASGGNINIFNNDQRISVLAQINNINQQNFSSDDLLGVMSGSGGRGRGGMRGGGRGFGGNNVSNFLVDQSNGVNITKAFGINYSDKWSKSVDFTGSYFFNLTDNDAESNTNRDYILSTATQQIYNESSSSTAKNINHRLDFRLNYQIDENNSILFRPRLTIQQNDGSSNVTGITSSGTNTINSSTNLFNSNLSAFNSNNDLLLRHRFEKRGRTISLALNSTFNNNTGDNNLFSEALYYDNLRTSDTVNQISNLTNHGYSGSTNLIYTEPISENGLLNFNAGFSYSEDNSDQKTYSFQSIDNSYSKLENSLSNVYKKIYKTQSIGTGYRYHESNLSLAANISYNISRLENGQSFPQNERIERNFYSILPFAMLHYKLTNAENIRLFYRASNDAPSVDQLQNVLDNSNPTQLSIGNPALAQDYKHMLVLRYSSTERRSFNSFFILFSGTYTQNYIGRNTIIASRDTTVLNNIFLNRGTQLTIPVNLDGYMSFRSFVTYGLSVDFIKSNLNLNASVNYSRTPGMINTATNYANSIIYGVGFVLSSNISDKVDFTISSNSSYNNVQNTLQSTSNNNYFNQNTRLKFYWRFWEGFIFQNDLQHQYDNGLSQSYNRNILLWNISLGKKFLKDDAGELRIAVNDLLNQNTNIQHNVSDSYTEDVRSNVIGRYFLVSFIYNLKAF